MSASSAAMRPLAAGLLCLVSGCSFIFTTAPPDRVTPYTTLTCTTGNAAPAIDAVLSVLSGVGTIVESNQGYPAGYIAAGVAWTALYSISAIYGFNVTSSCRDATERRDQLAEEEERLRRWREESRWRSMQPGNPR